MHSNIIRNSLMILAILIFISCGKRTLSDGYLKIGKSEIYKIDYFESLYIESSKEILLSFNEKFSFFDPYKITSPLENFLTKSIYSSLFYINTETELPEKNLVEDYVISSNGLKYNFILKKDIQLSNGTILDVDDILASFDLLKTYFSDYSIYNSFFIFNQKLQFEKISQNEFSIEIDKPNGNLLFALCNYPILPEETIKNIQTIQLENNQRILSFEKNDFIGSGPYIIESINDKEIILIKNTSYFKTDPNNITLPYSERIILKLYSGHNKEILDFIESKLDILSIEERDFQDLYSDKAKFWDSRFIDTGFVQEKALIVYNCYNKNSKSYIKDIKIRKMLSDILANSLNLNNKKNNLFISDHQKAISDMSMDSYFKDINKDNINEFKDGNTIFLRLIAPQEHQDLIDLLKSNLRGINKLNFDTYFETLPHHSFIERIFDYKEYDIAIFYYLFEPGIMSYYRLLNKEKYSFFPYTENEEISKKIENQVKNCINAIWPEDQKIEIKYLESILKENCQFYPIFYKKKYYLINKNILNFKINSSVQDSFDLGTIEKMIKI